MWITFGQLRYPYDENFLSVSNYAMNNNLSENFTKQKKRDDYNGKRN